MPYIGKQLSNWNYLKLDDISSSFNGSTTTFSLTNGGSAYYPGSEFSILVSVGGVIQEPESAYQISNDEITFANAPTAQDSFFCVVLGDAIGINVPGNNTVNGAQMAKPFNYDGGLLYLDDSNNKVGINSTSPSVALDVVGDLKVTGNITGIGGTLGGTLIGNVYASSGISTFNDLRVTNNLTVEGTTTTLDTNLVGVDRIEVGANSNTVVGVAITQSGTADIFNLYDGSTEVFSVADGGAITATGAITANNFVGGLPISNEGNDRIITSSGSGAVNAEANLQFDGTNLFMPNELRHLGDPDTKMGFDTDTIKFETAGSERLRITSAGSVNIGGDYTQTSKKFKVTGNATIDGGLVVTGTLEGGSGFSISSGNLTLPSYIYHDGDSDTYYGFSGANQFSVFTGGTARVTVTDATTTVANNLTVTGNFQVDGTNTVVNSTTMTVDDKNIVLGSGAANDAAADGGGITLESGDGNKTWNWVDATDAWTSSEHIHLGDDKKLLVGASQDLAIYHDGSDSYVKHNGTGNFYVQTSEASVEDLYLQAGNDVYIRVQTGDTAIKAIGDGAVELYHDNAKKLETASTGISVTGNADISGYVNVGGQNSHFSENNLRFKPAGHAYIDHNTTSQSIYFRVSNSSSNDTNALILAPSGNATFAATVTATTFSGSGASLTNVNATTLDSIDSGSFLRSDADDTSSGTIAFGTGALDPDSFGSYSGGFGNIADGGGWGVRGLFVHGGTAGEAAAIGHNSDKLYFGIQDGSSANSMETWLVVTPGTRVINFQTDADTTNVQIGGNKIFHAGNDGSGSGLDADTVDGFDTSQSGGAHKVLVSDSSNYLILDSWMRVANSQGIYAAGGSHLYNGGASTWKGWINRSTNTSACGIGMESSDGTDRGWVYADTAHVGLLNAGGSWLFKCPIGNQNAPETGGGYGLWHSGNDGSGSGLDADKLDGMEPAVLFSTGYAQTAQLQLRGHSNSWPGGIKFISNDGNNEAQLHMDNSTNYDLMVDSSFYVGGDLKIAGLSNIAWHAGNDGSGSGLDADKVDGVHLDGLVQTNNNQNYMLMFGHSANSNHNTVTPYAIYQEGGSWNTAGGGSGYPDLRINYHTGIVLAAHQNYGGVRIQRDYNDATELMSIGNGDNHVRIANNLYISGETIANGGITITSQDIISSGSSNWTGNPGASTLKIQAHSNRWYIVANSNANRICQFRVDGTDRTWIANDGQIYHGSSGSGDKYWREGNDGHSSGLDADTLDGLQLGTGRNNSADEVVRTNGSGYIDAGYINTSCDDTGTGTDCKFYASQDDYIRYIDKASMRSVMNVSARSGVYDGRESSTTDTNYWVGSMGWGAGNFDTTVWDYGSGAFDVWSNPSGQPSGTSHWTGLQSMHYSNGSARYGMRITCGAGQPALAYIQGRWNTTTYGWHKLWNEANDGSGSGLDADTVDGVQASRLLGSYGNNGTTGWEDSNGNFRLNSGASGSCGIAMHTSNGTFGFQLYASGGTNYGFLDGNWAGWDIKKTVNGDMFLNGTSNRVISQNDSPTFVECYVSNWFRNNGSGEGLYNTSTTQHWYSDDDDIWNLGGGSSTNSIRFRDESGGTVRGYVYANTSNQIGFLNPSGGWHFMSNNTYSTVQKGHSLPWVDDNWDLGWSTLRWNNVYAASSTINTSDERLKQDIASLTTAEMNAAKRLSALFKTYRWKDAVVKKGTDKARTHTGIIAQQIVAAMEAEGLDYAKYGFICYDEFYQNDEGEIINLHEAYNHDVKDSSNLDGYTKTGRFSVRYAELLSFIAAYNEQRFTSIESRLSALEGS